MKSTLSVCFAVKLILIITVYPCFSEEANTTSSESRKYLDAVRTFADNVLKYGRDTYGPKHTPLFVDGINIHTHEPVKWRRNGEVWILSNMASQQNLFRTLDALTTLTGDPKYRQAAIEAIEYAFKNLRSSNGLLFWGGHVAYDALADDICMEGYVHELEHHYPYYELMWQVDPIATRHFIEAFWSAHILDWSNLDMNRHGPMSKAFTNPWKDQYKGGPVFFEGRGIPFLVAGSDLYYAGAMLYRLAGSAEPLIWSKRLAHRYIETRNPKIGISARLYSRASTQEIPLKIQLGDDFPGHLLYDGTEFPPYGGQVGFDPWVCQLLLGGMLTSDGKEYTQWAIEELTALGKVAYRQKDNSWIPMLLDGTSLEGYVCKKDGPLGPKGTQILARQASPGAFWAYAMAWRITGNGFMWQMARDIAKGNGFGDIGEDANSEPRLEMDTTPANGGMLLGFLELFRKTKKKAYLEIAQKMGDIILDSHFHKGFFISTNKHLYAKFDNAALILLHLAVASRTDAPHLPQVMPGWSYFHCPYDGFGRTYDFQVLYSQTEENHLDFEIFAAVHSGDTRELSGVISKGANINATNGSFWGDTPLHYAVRQGHKEIVELLLAKGADVNAKNRNGEMPLDVIGNQSLKEITELLVANKAEVSTIHTAARLEDVKQVKAFLGQGTDVNAKDEYGRTALHAAVSNKSKDMVEFLIDHGADINAKNNKGHTPLYEAAWHSDANIAKLLVRNGADVDAKDNTGYIPLSWAIWNNDRDMMKFLVTNGADVNFVGEGDWPFLHYLTWNNDRELVELFLTHGAKLNVKDDKSRTELHIAVSRGNRDLARFLVSKGATAPELHLAACLGDLARVKSLVEQGTDVDTQDERGWTPLYWAASMAEEEVGEFLIGEGASIDVRTNNDRTPLHQAATAGAAKLTSLLISKGADSNARDKGNGTPLHSAAGGGHRNVVELLIGNGAEVKAMDTSGDTPLHKAARAGHADVVEVLLAHGADANAKNNRQQTALTLAKEKGHNEIVELLRKHGAKE